ncbi:MAG: YjbE family putative metal transport protein [Actinomycetota bacterium]|jgi:YjbE family integral membrane protein|nr:YjbE family putative metal transport protein [Actinomycetota bacterium]
MEFMTGEWFGRLLGVLVVNLILSGDNAVVIAMAARTLEGANRRKAIIWGAAGAVVLRLVFAAVITLLLEVPLLQVVGGLLLVWIAWKLIHEGEGGDDDEDKVKAGASTWQAVRIIIVADAVMSLDNVIALVQAAKIGGEVDISLLVIGLATTIPLVIFGAALLTSLLTRFPFLVYLGAGLLIYLAVEMIFADKLTHPYLEHYESIEWIIGIAAAGIFMLVAWLWARRSSTDETG